MQWKQSIKSIASPTKFVNLDKKSTKSEEEEEEGEGEGEGVTQGVEHSMGSL
tara:strand:+ start:646 stop:801 length:156 start_codon:yes stop_codon:yes gene_type:complete